MLDENTRLTHQHAEGQTKRTQYGWTRYWTPASKFALMNRLGEYEDLGYTPEELKEIMRPKHFRELFENGAEDGGRI